MSNEGPLEAAFKAGLSGKSQEWMLCGGRIHQELFMPKAYRVCQELNERMRRQWLAQQ